MNSADVAKLERKLDKVIALLATGLVTDTKLADAAPMLSRAGLDAQEIARIFDANPGSVHNALSSARTKAKKAGGRKATGGKAPKE